MKKTHAVWTCHDAVAAADAPCAVNKYYTVLCLVGCPNRADLDTGRFCTLVAEFRYEKALGNLVRRDFVFAYL